MKMTTTMIFILRGYTLSAQQDYLLSYLKFIYYGGPQQYIWNKLILM